MAERLCINGSAKFDFHSSIDKMSEILGLGVNTYRLYENGEMPTVSNGRLIMSVRDPEEFVRQVEASFLSRQNTSAYFYGCKMKDGSLMRRKRQDQGSIMRYTIPILITMVSNLRHMKWRSLIP